MQNVKQVLQGAELDRRTAGLLAGGACVAGVLAVLVSKFKDHWQQKAKIQRARERRAESLQRAEQLVLQHNESVRVPTSADHLGKLCNEWQTSRMSDLFDLFSALLYTLKCNYCRRCCLFIYLFLCLYIYLTGEEI